ncbi:contactin-5-like isoform X2 [Mya arenaria]|uniref:contactin-5-like isoform X2 n=1 Tax=Mya arenaria TaxID=6604 RepID=UPI0022E67E29|nr:contactin-5-like isoform X2 [Mya arenaria]
MELFILFGILLCGQVLSLTLSGNGTSGGFTVQENASLQLTCSSSTEVQYVNYYKRYTNKSPDTITAVGYGLSGCGTDPLPPSYLSCSCVSRKEYVCVIRTVTRQMNGDVWFCLPRGGDVNDNSGDKPIVVTIGITSVSMVFPAVDFVSVIKNTAREFRCETSAGNPQATVEWYKDHGTPGRADDIEITSGKETYSRGSGSLIVTSGKLTLTVQGNDDGVGVYCRAENGGDWQYSLSVVIDVQFGPQVNLPGDHPILEDRGLNYSCSYTPGNPSQTSFVWTRSVDNKQWNSRFVNISSVQRSDDGIYTCTATNRMTPSGSNEQIGKHNGTLHLNVLYESFVSSFTIAGNSGTDIVTKSEFSKATLICTVDSNPPASINIRKDGKTRRSVDNSKLLEYTVENLTCWDAGLYKCNSSNKYNNAIPSKKDLKLFVRCSPRRPPGEDIKFNFTARQHEHATLEYTVFAYPVPKPSQFVWKKCKTTCANLPIMPRKYEIKTTELSSNLTVLDIGMDDYGVYSISINNDIGEELVEELYLQPAGQPELPTEFHVIDEYLSETQAIVIWTPGFNNGLHQTFHLSYTKFNELTSFTTVNISHNEVEEKMNYTLNKLTPGTQYYVELFASNAEGNSMKVNVTFTTLVHQTNAVALIGGSIGDVPDVVENSTYVPVGDISPNINNSDADALYTQPNKIKASGSAAAPKKHGKKSCENKTFEDSTLDGHELQEKKKNVNKDGLVYADLDFPKPRKGQKPYIHCVGDKTVYEEVDLSQKAEPLPDSDDDEATVEIKNK